MVEKRVKITVWRLGWGPIEGCNLYIQMCIIGPKSGLVVICPLENALDLKEPLDNPETAAFPRLKYLQCFACDEQIAQFLNCLFQSAANARFDGKRCY